MQRNDTKIRELVKADMETLWHISSRLAEPTWAKFNAPYFQEYKQTSWPNFTKNEQQYYIKRQANQGIFYQDKLVGNISHYWEDERTRWMEFGLVIYDETVWGKGIGFDACTLWIDFVFALYPEIQRIGCTTWSGNPGMMKLAQKLGMQQEACLRKVRYFEGTYYDSLRFGILRDEWIRR